MEAILIRPDKKIIYLDQNIWVQIAQLLHDKPLPRRRQEAAQFLVKLLKSEEFLTVISAIHYMELWRVKNYNRRQALGEVIWELARGRAILSNWELVKSEIEFSLQKYFPQIIPTQKNLIDYGFEYAFGPEGHWDPIPVRLSIRDQKNIFLGQYPDGKPIPAWVSNTYRVNFREHLEELPRKISQIPNGTLIEKLSAIELLDIQEPLNQILIKWNIPPEFFGSPTNCKYLVDYMPARRTNRHLHLQILKNRNLKPRNTDLEDWAALSIAAQYADILICEKHFANLIKRDKFQTWARIFPSIESWYEGFNSNS